MKAFFTILLLSISTSSFSCSLERLEEFTDSIEEEARAEIFTERFQRICQDVVDNEKCLIDKAEGNYLEIGRIGAALMSCKAVLNNK